jgi:choline dehydrogenase-like flavoprotein
LVTASTVDRDGIQILGLNHLGADAPADLAMLLIALMRPLSEGGTVRLRSDDPTVAPIVEFGLLDHPVDRTRLADGVRRAVGLLSAPPFAEVVETTYIDDRGTTVEALDDDRSVEEWLVRSGADYVHATSSTAAVLDENGALRDHESVFVCDASAFPGIPDANTHLPTTMLAERLTARWPGVAGSSP